MSHKGDSIIRLIDQIRDCSVDVLIQGESGTGKELVARASHYNSPAANGPFVALNCAAMPDNLVEAELFGIERASLPASIDAQANSRRPIAASPRIFRYWRTISWKSTARP
jgi:DNA-binding NtrC family response regulator